MEVVGSNLVTKNLKKGTNLSLDLSSFSNKQGSHCLHLYKKVSLSAWHSQEATPSHSSSTSAFPSYQLCFEMSRGRGSAAQAMVMAVVLILCLLLHFEHVHAATYAVGDAGGWTFNTDSWPKGKRFRAGDVLSKFFLIFTVMSKNNNNLLKSITQVLTLHILCACCSLQL